MATMAAIRTQNATTSTALAINKATEIFNDTQTLNCEMQLRLTNLEKNFHHQEQKPTKSITKLTRNKKTQTEVVRRSLRPLNFQKAPTLPQNNKKSQLVDLTMEQKGEPTTNKRLPLQNH
jgi:hypothetical protein